MERSRQRKSRSGSGNEEVPQTLKYKSVTRYSAGLSSYIDGSSREDDKHKIESRRRSQNAIARLLGLNGLPSIRLIHKHKSSSLERELYHGRSYRDHHNFRDEYNDLEAPLAPNRRSSRWSASSMPTKFEMLLAKQKLREFERDSADEKRAADETLDLFYSNKHSSIEVLKWKDSRDMDYGHGPRFNSRSSHDNQNEVLLGPRDYENYDRNAFIRRRTVPRKDGLLLEPYYSQRTHVSNRSSKARYDRIIPHPRIVVLRPAPQSTENAHESDSFDRDVLVYGNIEDFSNNGGYKTVSRRRSDSADIGLRRNEAKETTGETIARRARSGRDDTVDAKSRMFRGYVPYDDAQGSGDLEVCKFPGKYYFNDERRCKQQPPGLLSARSTNTEAKKKLVERWRTTRKFRDLEIVNANRTLGEMLSVSGGERRSKHADAKTSQGKTTIRDDSFGIRGKGSRKNDDNDSTPLLASGTRGDVLIDNKKSHTMYGAPLRRSNHRISVRKSGKNIKVSPQDSKCRRKKSTLSERANASEMSPSTDANFEIQMEANVKQLRERELRFQMPSKDAAGEGGGSDVMANAGKGNASLNSESLDTDRSAADDQKRSGFQELDKGKPEQCPFDYVNNTDSIDEVPFSEDMPSASDCFETVSAELQELRKHIQLLNMESEEMADASSSSDLVPPQRSPIHSQENSLLEQESWECSYILDVLINSGLQDSDFDLFSLMWHCSDSPLDPILFDELEKSFDNKEEETDESSSQRRLLFDRANASLCEILKRSIDLYPWVMPGLASPDRSKSHREVVLEAFERMIGQEFFYGEMIERSLDSRLQRLEYKGEIDGIGIEIEELLIADMIVEFLS